MIDINPSEQEPREVSGHPLTLRDFAKQQHMTEDRVWELIEEGELAARFVNDEILLIREMEPDLAEPSADLLNASAPEISVAVAAASLCSEQLTAQLDHEMDLEIETESLAQKDQNSGHKLDDHRELLLFAQDAMSRNMELSRQLLATKDELIRLKDEQIRQFQQRIDLQDRDLRLLRRQIENLETLCKVNSTS